MKRLIALTALAATGGCVVDNSTYASPSPAAPAPSAPAASEVLEAPSGMQWMYGSAEGSASSLQVYRAMLAQVQLALANRPASSVVLRPNSSLEQAAFIPCADKPLAVVLDVDETALQNLGYEYADALDGTLGDRDLLRRWQSAPQSQARPMPGARETLDAIRALGVTVVFNTNRDNIHTAATAGTIELLGLGPAVSGDTLFLRGDVDGERGKDGRREYVAGRYCVVALAGDNLGDFSDQFNERDLAPLARRQLASLPGIAERWGAGWHLLANPVYGPGLEGTVEDVFAPDVRWSGE